MRKSLDKEINILLFWIGGNINFKFEYYGCFNACSNDKVMSNIKHKDSAFGSKR